MRSKIGRKTELMAKSNCTNVANVSVYADLSRASFYCVWARVQHTEMYWYGGYSTYLCVGRCGPATQTLTPFKTKTMIFLPYYLYNRIPINLKYHVLDNKISSLFTSLCINCTNKIDKKYVLWQGLACPKSEYKTQLLHLLLFIPIAEFDPPDQCFSCGMSVWTKMLCDGKTRRALWCFKVAHQNTPSKCAQSRQCKWQDSEGRRCSKLVSLTTDVYPVIRHQVM